MRRAFKVLGLELNGTEWNAPVLRRVAAELDVRTLLTRDEARLGELQRLALRLDRALQTADRVLHLLLLFGHLQRKLK